MNLDLTDVQAMLVSTASDFLSQHCGTAVVRDAIEKRDGYAPELWEAVGSLGWSGLTIEGEYGGAGLEFLDLVLLLEEAGKHLLPAPLASNAAVCGPTLQQAGGEAQKKAYLSDLASGKTTHALAVAEGASYDPQSIETRAHAHGDGYVLDGRKLFVRDGAIADFMLVATRTGDGPRDITLFIVDSQAEGVAVEPLPTIGADRQAMVTFVNVRVPVEAFVGELNAGWPLVEDALQRAALAECAELSGIGQAVLRRTVEYAADRIQFGRAIGSFQTIQHKCADMSIAAESARFLTYKAASTYQEGRDASLLTSQCKMWASEAVDSIVTHAQQIHAGVGYIKEYDLHLYFERAKGALSMYGTPEWHRGRAAQIIMGDED